MEASCTLILGYLAGALTGASMAYAYLQNKQYQRINSDMHKDFVAVPETFEGMRPGLYTPNKKGELEYRGGRDEQISKNVLQDLAEHEEVDMIDEFSKKLRVGKRG